MAPGSPTPSAVLTALEAQLPDSGFHAQRKPALIKRSKTFSSDDSRRRHLPLQINPSRVVKRSASLRAGRLEQISLTPSPSSSSFDATEPATPLRRGATDELADRTGGRPVSADLGIGFGKGDEESDQDTTLPPYQSELPFQSETCDDAFFDFDALPPLPKTMEGRGSVAANGTATESPTAAGGATGAGVVPRTAGIEELQAVARKEGPVLPISSGPAQAPERTTTTRTPLQLFSKSPGSAKKRHSSAPPKPHSGGLRVVVLANGSSGDVLPMLALSRCLMDRHKHVVRVLTNSNLVRLCKDKGVDALPVFADTEAAFQSIGGIGGSLTEGVRRGFTACQAWLKSHPGACAAVEDALKDFQPEALIYGSGASGPGIRYARAACLPAIPVWLQRETLEIFQDQLHMQPPRPQFFAVSQYLSRSQLPKAKRLHRTANWTFDEEPTLDEATKAKLEPLLRFLADGPPPVAVGWGSMIAEGLPPAGMLRLALGALQLAGRRGVVLGGWARLHELGAAAAGSMALRDFASREVCFVENAPHRWLFPQCSCVIHHGGSGTSYVALQSGTPSVITPVFADQFAIAKAIHDQGAGIGFREALPAITQRQLKKAVLDAEARGRSVKEVAEKMRHEKGVQHAGSIIDAFLRREVKTGQWARKAQQTIQWSAPPAH